MTLRITLPPVPEIELVAVEGLDRLGRHLGIAEEKLGEARILVTEAIINAFEHGKAGDAGVDVEYTMDREHLVIFVRDHGPGFDPTTIEDPDIRTKFGGGRKRGWGLKLLRTLSDDFRLESTPDGTRITLKKNLI
jgi:anti-sigma regulatory factor (Ser/Thr protein kinase)